MTSWNVDIVASLRVYPMFSHLHWIKPCSFTLSRYVLLKTMENWLLQPIDPISLRCKNSQLLPVAESGWLIKFTNSQGTPAWALNQFSAQNLKIKTNTASTKNHLSKDSEVNILALLKNLSYIHSLTYIYIYMYICIHTCISYTYTYIGIHIFFIHTFLFTYIYMYICICTMYIRYILENIIFH